MFVLYAEQNGEV